MPWEAVYRWVRKIPRGRVVTYGQLARALQLRGGARTAGRALAACPAGRGIPWQRVVGAGGKLLLREPLRLLQRRLLEAEGVRLTGGRVDLARHQWTPSRAGHRRSRGAVL
ncbi:MAG: MGMT family protein [Firmicutes bacterium]|nr:MGMT family protein [Bacillota bacterium]